MNKALYLALKLLTILLTLAGIATLIPVESASYPNIMGYKSLCTFAPAATVFCFLLAGITCFIRATFVKETEGTPQERLKKHLHSLAPLVLLLLLGLGLTFWFINVKARYVEATSAATADAEIQSQPMFQPAPSQPSTR